MADIVISAAGKAVEVVAEPLVDSISTQFGYIRNCKLNFDNLDKQVKRLQLRRDVVNHAVEEAIRKGEQIEPLVQDWLDRVDKIIHDTTRIIEDNNRTNMRCFKCLCPDLKKRYQQSKKAAVKVREVSELQEEGTFEKVSYRIPPKERWRQFLKDYEDFESRRSIVESVLTELHNDVSTVGIYGMGGAGKTTIARVVGKIAEKENLFDVVVFVEVSEAPEVRKIQGVIADTLGLEFGQESDDGRANKLCEQLLKQSNPSAQPRKERKILLILDNIWEGLVLRKIGIPLGDDDRAFKLLWTARKADVLSDGRNSVKTFHVDKLNDEDTWALFQKVACIEKQPGLQTLASQVANKCGGLPIAVVTVAKALKGKPEHAWREALRQLEQPFTDVGSVTRETYSCIFLSYNQLNSEEKLTFSLCSIMGFTSDASVEELLRYGLGLGLFEAVNTVEEARNKVKTMITNFKASSLLLSTPNDELFSLHDVVRDVGRGIAFKYHNRSIVIGDEIPRKWNILKNCTSISLHDIAEFPKKELDCPQLKFLYMKGKNKYVQIPDKFFIGMRNLRVLHLIKIEFSPPPLSLHCLVNLRTLCLKCSSLRNMRNMSFIKDMMELEILMLSCKALEQLPMEIGQLTQLKVLDLRECYGLKVIPPGIISKLTQLEEFYLNFEFDKWHVEGLDNENSNASLDELRRLSQLTTLHIYIQDNNIVSNGLFSQKLQRYNICIGVLLWDCESGYATSRTLKLKSNADGLLEDGVITQLKEIADLYLEGSQGVKNVLHELDSDVFAKLKHLDIFDNHDLLCLVDSSKKLEPPCDAFPLLETLSLGYLMNLEQICHGQLTPNSFRPLKSITVASCANLKNIFSFSVARHLSQLQEISVTGCQNMEEIFEDDRRNYVTSNEVSDYKVVFDQLQSLSLRYLPKLRSFCSTVEEVTANVSSEIVLEDKLDIPMPFFDGKVEFPNLKDLSLRKVNFEKIWHHNPKIVSSCFQNLTCLRIWECNNLNYIFSSSTLRSFVQLQEVDIRDCQVLEEIIRTDGFESNVELSSLRKLNIQNCHEMKMIICSDKVSFPILEEITICEMGNLEVIIGNDDLKDNVEFPSLKKLEIMSCPKMKTFIFSDKVSFPNLEEIEIWKLDNLEMIIRNDDLENTVEFPSLKKLKITSCPEMKTFIFSDKVSFPNLEEIQIYNLKNLEMIWQNQLTKDSINAQSCEKLCKMDVQDCQSLKNLFPPSIAKNLLRLKYLYVTDCGIEEVIAKEGAEDAVVKMFKFPQLNDLRLVHLRNLRCFYPGLCTVEWPVTLKNLDIVGCEKLDKLFVFGENVSEGQLDISAQHLFLVNQVFSSLEKLMLDGDSSRMISQTWFSKILFPKLRVLNIQNDESTELPNGIFKRFPNLKRLSLQVGCSYKEIFPCEELEKQVQIKSLSIDSLRNLKQIWKQDTKVDMILQNLENLTVENCGSLVTLLPPSACCENVTILTIEHCNGLLNLLSSSTSKSLVSLKEMSIRYCNLLTEVVSDERAGIEVEINFSKLKSLELEGLSRLRSFCSRNYTFNFPSLERLSLEDCPKMKIFASGNMSTPLLRKIKLDYEKYPCEGDVNKTLQQIHEKMLSSAEQLSLSGKDVTRILKELPEHQFVRLKQLMVFDDESIVFPFGILGRFHNLIELKLVDSSYKEIFSCDEDEKQHAEMSVQIKSLEMEKLDNLEQMWKEDSKLEQILCNLDSVQVKDCNNLITLMPFPASFQNLKSLTVVGCKGLINILSSSTAKSLQQLECMIIEGCEMMIEIVGNKDMKEDTITFSELRVLKLINLSSLTSFYFGNCTLDFPSLFEVTVSKCPKMKFFTSGVLSTTVLEEIRLDDCEYTVEIDLNKTIQLIYEKRYSKSCTKDCQHE